MSKILNGQHIQILSHVNLTFENNEGLSTCWETFIFASILQYSSVFYQDCFLEWNNEVRKLQANYSGSVIIMAYAKVQSLKQRVNGGVLQEITKQFVVRCICGDRMVIAHAMSAYNSSTLWCDGCSKKMSTDEYTFHCPQKRSSQLHPRYL